MPIQLTDDAINSFVLDLSNFLQYNPLVTDPEFAENEGYEHLREFVYNKLERFSNGYMNYN